MTSAQCKVKDGVPRFYRGQRQAEHVGRLTASSTHWSELVRPLYTLV